MTYLGDYEKKMKSRGDSPKDTLSKDSVAKFKRMFEHSTAYEDIEFAGEKMGIHLFKGRQPYYKKIVFYPGYEPMLGSLATIGEYDYLVYDKDKNKITESAYAQRCNHQFPVVTGTERKIIGYENGRPVVEEVEQIELTPCIMEEFHHRDVSKQQFSAPVGSVSILIPYKYYNYVDINFKFIMFGDKNYKITDILLSGVVDGEGLVELIAGRVAGEDDTD